MYKKDVINSQKELKIISQNNEEINTKAKYGPSKITRIPLNINENLAFFVATIIGDGHLKKSKFQITIECANNKLIFFLRDICKEIFKRDFNVYPRKIIQKGRQKRFCLIIDSKAIHNLLQYVFEIPKGKKSDIVKIPEYIKKTNKSIKAAFIIGILTTEGGKRRRGYGLSTASKKFLEGIINLLDDIGISTKKDKWINRKYQKEYYGMVFKKEGLINIIKICNNRKVRKIMSSCTNFN